MDELFIHSVIFFMVDFLLFAMMKESRIGKGIETTTDFNMTYGTTRLYINELI